MNGIVKKVFGFIDLITVQIKMQNRTLLWKTLHISLSFPNLRQESRMTCE